MKNYNSLQEFEMEYIVNTDNKSVHAPSYGPNFYYYNDVIINNSFRAFPMVDINTFQYILRCDPISDEEYDDYVKFCEDNGNPEWITLS